MICPNCAEDTNPTLKFCEFCGSTLEIDFERAGAALAYESDEAAIERLDQKTLGYLYFSIYVLVVIIICRIIVNKPVKIQDSQSYTVPKTLSSPIKPGETISPKIKKVVLPPLK